MGLMVLLRRVEAAPVGTGCVAVTDVGAVFAKVDVHHGRCIDCDSGHGWRWHGLMMKVVGLMMEQHGVLIDVVVGHGKVLI